MLSRIVAATGSDAPLAVVKDFAWATPLGLILFAVAVIALYTWTRRQAAEPLTP
jgi:hypothetical protein